MSCVVTLLAVPLRIVKRASKSGVGGGGGSLIYNQYTVNLLNILKVYKKVLSV